MTDINKLWRKHIEDRCVHDEGRRKNFGGDFNWEICKKCEQEPVIPAYDEDPAVFKWCILNVFLHINPCDCWPPGNDRTHIEDECVPNKLVQRTVMELALKAKGVAIND